MRLHKYSVTFGESNKKLRLRLGWPSQKQTQNGFATAAAGGLDYNFNRRISFKPIQVEYVMTQLNTMNGFGGPQNDICYSAGVVFKFGEK